MFEEFFKHKSNINKKMDICDDSKEKVYLLNSRSISKLSKKKHKNNAYSNESKMGMSKNLSKIKSFSILSKKKQSKSSKK